MTPPAIPEAQAPAGLPPVASGEASAALAAGPAAEGQPGPALIILTMVAVVFALDWAQSFFISLLLGILFAYTLNPLVVGLTRIRLPRVAGASLVMLSAVAGVVLGTALLAGQIQSIVDQLPLAASKLARELTAFGKEQASTMQKVQSVANELRKATRQVADAAATPRPPATRVVIEAPVFRLDDFLWSGSMGAARLVGHAFMVLCLTFFLLLAGTTYRRKLVRLAGPTLARRKITLRILDDIHQSIQRYMFTLLATNVLTAVLTWIALRWIGLENASAWAVAAGLLRIIPYLGPGLTATVIGIAGFIQFDALSTGLLLAGISGTINTVVGIFVIPWMTGRIASINVTALFVSLFFWAWLWGVWGLLLSMPITVIVKVLAQQVEALKVVAELLTDESPVA
jgi:predicted PurR-regulated permease PerM